MTPSLLLRADGGPGIGVGHLARCLAVAQAWVDRGGQTVLLSANPPEKWADRFRSEGVDVRDPADPEAGALAGSADWVLIDGYHLAGEQLAIRPLARRLVVIDDHGTTGGELVADLLVDQNLGATPAPYAGRGAGTELLLGPRYAMLRREFRRLHSQRGDVPPRAGNLLVALGGSPSDSVTRLVEAALADPRLRDLAVTRLAGVDDVAGAMAGADLALSASGTTCWELCCMGVPAVLVPVAENQEPLAAALAACGVAVSAGPLQDVSTEDLVARVADLSNDADRRREMAERGRRLVDGRGARRVVTRMVSGLLAVRPVTEADARLLWEWANDPQVRAASFSTEPISWATHLEWLGRRVADAHSHLYVVAAPDGTPVGQVRFQGSRDQAEVGVTLAPEARGRGLGAAVVEAGVRRLFATSPVVSVVARIKPENVASQASFEDADFVRTDDGQGGRTPQLQYARAKEGEPATCLTSH